MRTTATACSFFCAVWVHGPAPPLVHTSLRPFDVLLSGVILTGGELIPPHLQSGTVPATAVLQAVGSEEPGSHMCIYTPLAVVKNCPGRVATSPLLPSTIPYVITTSGVDGSGAQGAAPAGSAAAVRTTGAGLPVPSPHPSSGYCCTAPGSTQPRQPRAGLPLPPSPTLRNHGIRFQNVSTTLVVLTFIP